MTAAVVVFANQSIGHIFSIGRDFCFRDFVNLFEQGGLV
jgi:hypothetical protein